MQEYLQSMDAFLAVQESVMQAYLAPAPFAGSRYPLLGGIAVHRPGEELVATRDVSLTEDLYLRDHILGREVSLYDDGDLHGLAVMPLAMSIEMLAEAAAYLVPGLAVIGLRGVRANRWLTWEDDERHTLQVTARRQVSPNPQEAWVAVQLRDLTVDLDSDSPAQSPVVEATVVLAADYPHALAPRARHLADGYASRWRSDELYVDGMFHGPTWQCLAQVDQTSPTGILASMRVLTETGLFASHRAPEFELDPIILDGAGQMIGLWTLEHLASGQVIFPFQLDALDIFGSRRRTGEEVDCVADVRLIGDKQVRSDIDVIDADGQLWMRLSGGLDKRFDVPTQFYPLILSPGQAEVSSPWPEAVAQLSPGALECRRVGRLFDADHAFWKRVWANCTLSRAEREQFRQLRLPEPRQLDWLATRTAAKEAVRALLRRAYGLETRHADIDITTDETGRPVVRGAWVGWVDAAPVVSLTQGAGWGAAVAGLGRAPTEARLLEALPATLRPEWLKMEEHRG
jgi:phosphopantetheinyl transferase (holo-ACP synthase)